MKFFWKILWKLIFKRSKTENKLVKKSLSLIIVPFLEMKNSYIASGTKFESQPTFPHGIIGIFISNKAVIGKGVTIFHQVTIGSNNLGDSNKLGSPTIGDNCYIGAGAKIIGNIKIGNNVRIGANAVVVKDIPDNCMVVNQPTRVIFRENNMNNNNQIYNISN